MKRAAAGSVGSCGAGGEPLPRSHVGEGGPQARDTDTKRIAIQPSNAPWHADGRARRRSLRISRLLWGWEWSSRLEPADESHLQLLFVPPRVTRASFPRAVSPPCSCSKVRAAASPCGRASLVLAGGEERQQPPKVAPPPDSVRQVAAGRHRPREWRKGS